MNKLAGSGIINTAHGIILQELKGTIEKSAGNAVDFFKCQNFQNAHLTYMKAMIFQSTLYLSRKRVKPLWSIKNVTQKDRMKSIYKWRDFSFCCFTCSWTLLFCMYCFRQDGDIYIASTANRFVPIIPNNNLASLIFSVWSYTPLFLLFFCSEYTIRCKEKFVRACVHRCPSHSVF